MKHTDPLHVVWWLVSRASGVLALVLISLAVLLGLAMAAKVIRRPGLKRAGVRLHEHVALISLAAIGVHGLALLGDAWLKPGFRDLTVPFAMSYRPSFTGLGIIAGYLALLVGPSFYLRRRIGARRWRALHRISVIIWLLSAVHTLGSGSDAQTLWLRIVVLAPVAPVVYLLVMRVNGTARARARAPGASNPDRPSVRRAPEQRKRGQAPRQIPVPFPE